MKHYEYSTITEVPAARLCAAIADIRRWPDWDRLAARKQEEVVAVLTLPFKAFVARQRA